MSTDTTDGNTPEDRADGPGAESAAWASALAQVDAESTEPGNADAADPRTETTAGTAAQADMSDETAAAPQFPPSAPDPSAARPTAPASASPERGPVQADAGPAAPEPGPRSKDDILLDGSSVVGRPKSRAAAHWAGVLVWLVALPLAWYLLHDGAATAVDGAAPLSFGTPVRALLELGAGAVVLAIALWTASRSSLGSFVVGAVSLLVGVPFLVAPTAMNGSVGPFLDRLTAHSNLGASLSAYFWADAVSGKFVAFGLFMIMVGVVSHNARRAGRREQEIIDRGRRDD